ncbi:MAG: hypothetical protein L0099_02235 [Acidobacteria bacterium]|nr:hypothetical protein [Acidobacteriota bacterium]
MMLSWMFVLLALAAVGLLLRAVRGQSAAVRSLEELEAQTRPVDLAAFRNLMDPDEQDYLRAHVSDADFRRLERQRLRAARVYVRRAAQNAAVLVRLGEAARASADPKVARAAQELVNSALQLRLNALLAECQLLIRMALPVGRPRAAGLLESYEVLIERVTRLCRLQRPAYTARVAAAL